MATRRGPIGRRKEIARELEIGARFRPRLLSDLAPVGFARPQHLDLRPDHCPHRQEKRKRGKTEQVASAPLRVEIGVEDRIRVSLEAALAEIHEQEGEIVEHVDRGERIVELDRVEQDGLALDLDDVAQVKIAVTVAHIASPRPRFEQAATTAASASRLDCVSPRASTAGNRSALAASTDSLSESTPSSGRTACFGVSHLSAEVWKAAIASASGRIAEDAEPALLGHALIEIRLIELAHAQRPFDHLSRAAKREKPIGRRGLWAQDQDRAEVRSAG